MVKIFKHSEKCCFNDKDFTYRVLFNQSSPGNYYSRSHFTTKDLTKNFETICDKYLPLFTDDEEEIRVIDSNRIDIKENQANVTYFLKIADVRNYIKGENFSTVAVTESPCYIKYKRNPSHSNNKITLSATGDFKYWNYIQVTAQIQQNKALDYVAYEGIKIEKENPSDSDDDPDKSDKPDKSDEQSDKNKKTDNPDKEKSNNTGLIVGISVALFIVIIGLVVVIFYFQKKNKSLMDQVKHVSFQQSNTASEEPDLLLHKSQNQNEPPSE